jgi:hypothetical protein
MTNPPSFLQSCSEGEHAFSLQYPASPPPWSHSFPNPLPTYRSSPSSVSSADLPVPSAPPSPFCPTDYPPSYHGYNVGPDKRTSNHDLGLPRVNIAHPYARLYARKEGAKRRKIWNHALEKSLFNPHELLVVST